MLKNTPRSFLLILLLFVLTKNILAEELGSETPSPEIKPETQPEEPVDECERLVSEGGRWFDKAQRYLSVKFCQPSVWFDDFFSTERVDEELRAGTHVRWQNDYILTKGGDWSYVANVNASFKLPKAKEKLHIIFESEAEEDLRDVIPADREEAKTNLGLLYEITRSERANFNVRVKLSPSINFRYRYQYPISDTFLARFTQSWYREDSMDNHASRLDFEKKIYDNFLLRQTNLVTHSERFNGEEWEHSLVLYQRLNDKSALSYESSLSRVTWPTTYVSGSRVGVRYRRNIFRKWLFYEVAPAVNWPRPLVTDVREPAWEILFRLEVNFINL